MTGSPGADTAAAYLARRFRQVGLQPAAGGWFQSFTVVADAPAAQHAHVGGLAGQERDRPAARAAIPVLRNETVIVGAHYDHLGLGGFGSLDPDSTGKVHNGADDNASGAAMLIQIAAAAGGSRRRPARCVFIAFSGEELGLLGSAYYVKQPIYPLAGTLAMINLDMVGRLQNGRLIVYGVAHRQGIPRAARLAQLVRRVRPQGPGRRLRARATSRRSTRPGGRCCTSSPICTRTITAPPTTGRRSTSTGSSGSPTSPSALVTALANRPGPLTLVDAPPSIRRPRDDRRDHAPATAPTSARPGHDATIPAGCGCSACARAARPRRRGSGATTSSPGSADMNVPDLQAMTDALRSHQPGDTVDIVDPPRRRESTTLRATLGTRGG